MNIWTQRLEQRDLPHVAHWLGRETGAITPNDLPIRAEDLISWFEACSAENGRLDCMALVYETPVGLTGLRQQGGLADTAAMYLLLGEVNYNPLRTATYVTLRMLDRAFLELAFTRVILQAYMRFSWFPEVLERMGFLRTGEQIGLMGFSVEKADFLERKYLF